MAHVLTGASQFTNRSKVLVRPLLPEPAGFFFQTPVRLSPSLHPLVASSRRLLVEDPAYNDLACRAAVLQRNGQRNRLYLFLGTSKNSLASWSFWFSRGTFSAVPLSR